MPEKQSDDNLNGEAVDKTGMAGNDSLPDENLMSGGMDDSQAPDDVPSEGELRKPKPHIVRLMRSIGMVMPSNRVRKFLVKGAIPPVNERKHFVARLKHLDRIEVLIVEGDEELADRNVVVGEVGLTNIRLREDGRAELEIDLALDENGMLIVTLTDRLSNIDCFGRFTLPQFSTEKVADAEISQVPVSELSWKIDLLEQQMKLLKGELAVRRERENS